MVDYALVWPRRDDGGSALLDSVYNKVFSPEDELSLLLK